MKIDHVQLSCPQGGEEQARAFFAGILAMEEEEKPEPLRERGGCWFRLGAVIVHVGIDPDFKPQGKAHPAFLVGDLEGLAAKLQAAGFVVKWDRALPDRRRFYSADPFGNRIEFMREGDGFGER